MKYLMEAAEMYRTLDLIDLNIETEDRVHVAMLLSQLRLQIVLTFKKIESDLHILNLEEYEKKKI